MKLDSFQINEVHFYARLGKNNLNLELSEKPTKARVCVCVRARCLMHDDWSFIFSALLRELSVCITAAKWTLATKDVHGKRVGERFEKYASKHKHSHVGIYSKRISHLIKTSPQLPGGLRHTKQPRVKFGIAPPKKKKEKKSVWEGERYIYSDFLQHFTCHNWACFFLYELEIVCVCT